MTIQNLTALTRPSINRVCRLGNVSAKMAAAMGLILGVNPFYLVGEADENIPCTDELLDIFLESKGYKKLLADMKRGKASKTAATPPASAASQASAPLVPAVPAVSAAAPDTGLLDLSDEEIYYLLAGLRVRAKINPDAQARYQKVLELLVK